MKDTRRIVYVTRSGKTYHTQDCSFAAHGLPMSLGDVSKSLKPCPKCNPPALDKHVPKLLVAAADPVVDPETLEKRAAAKLLLAKKLLRTNPAMGERWLNDLIEEYPGTKAAGEARKILQRL